VAKLVDAPDLKSVG